MTSTTLTISVGGPVSVSKRAANYMWSHIEFTDACWIWHGFVDDDNYGRLCGLPAYRVVYERLVGPIPDGLQLDHVCHTQDEACPGGNGCPHRRCVNPEHMEPVTAEENRNRAPALTRRSITSQEIASLDRTHCKNGHRYTVESCYRGRRGKLVCRPCRADASYRHRVKSRSSSIDGRGTAQLEAVTQ